VNQRRHSVHRLDPARLAIATQARPADLQRRLTSRYDGYAAANQGSATPVPPLAPGAPVPPLAPGAPVPPLAPGAPVIWWDWCSSRPVATRDGELARHVEDPRQTVSRADELSHLGSGELAA